MFSGTVLLLEFDGTAASISLAVRFALAVAAFSVTLKTHFTVEVNDLINQKPLAHFKFKSAIIKRLLKIIIPK